MEEKFSGVRLRSISYYLIATVGVVGISVLVGWVFNFALLKSALAGQVSMKPNTAVGFVGLAFALLLTNRVGAGRASRLLAGVLILFVAALSIATLAEYIFRVGLGIDELLVKDFEGIAGKVPPGRSAPITAVNFILLSCSIFASHILPKPKFTFAHIVAVFGFVIGFQGLTSYLLGINSNFGVAFYSRMAIHTTILFILLSLAILMARAEFGLMSIFTSKTEGGKLGRNLILTAIVVPPAVAFVSIWGEVAGFYDSNFTVLMKVVGNSIFFSALVWRNAIALHRSDLKKIEVEEALRRAVSVRDEFLNIASHELKTPVTSLKLQVQIAERRARPEHAASMTPEKQRELLGVMHRQINRLTVLIEELLDVSRIQTGSLILQCETFDIGPLIEDVIDRMKEHLDAARCQLIMNIDHDLSVNGDRSRLEQVITNLLSNTCKYAAGSTVEVTAHAQADSSVHILVVDHGMGIAPGKLNQIFERFERAISARNISGLGLGLYIARQIVQAHGGKIWAESYLGKGSAFHVQLNGAEIVNANFLPIAES